MCRLKFQDIGPISKINLSFRFSGNDIVAIVGENGAGKSTIIKLLLRLYKIDSGRILLNGKSIYSYDWIEYCRFFASAFQDYNMYALTLKENLLFGHVGINTEIFLEQIGRCIRHIQYHGVGNAWGVYYIFRFPYDIFSTSDSDNLCHHKKPDQLR